MCLLGRRRKINQLIFLTKIAQKSVLISFCPVIKLTLKVEELCLEKDCDVQLDHLLPSNCVNGWCCRPQTDSTVGPTRTSSLFTVSVPCLGMYNTCCNYLNLLPLTVSSKDWTLESSHRHNALNIEAVILDTPTTNILAQLTWPVVNLSRTPVACNRMRPMSKCPCNKPKDVTTFFEIRDSRLRKRI